MGIKRKIWKVSYKKTAILPDVIYIPQNYFNMRFQFALSFDF